MDEQNEQTQEQQAADAAQEQVQEQAQELADEREEHQERTAGEDDQPRYDGGEIPPAPAEQTEEVAAPDSEPLVVDEPPADPPVE